jgi:amino acid permease
MMRASGSLSRTTISRLQLSATATPGSDSFESIAAAAFGPKALAVTKGLVVLMCFFGTVGYAVLLRDMLEPISSAIYHTKAEGPSWEGNSVMLTVVLLVTPLCTLKTLTALKRFGAASMFSVLILGSCVLFRSLQCNIREASSDWKAAFRLFPESWRDILDVIPLYISCYVCHYNILTVHNEFRKPSAERISWWLSSTTWSATLFYLVLGFSGSAYSTCTADGSISGNILLDFPENDPLLLVGRMCLAITITLAFPMLTIPARDIVIRSIVEARSSAVRLGVELTDSEDLQAALAEPLLDESGEEANPDQDTTANPATPTTPLSASLSMRLGIAIILFWSAALMASCVESIDLVWDLLGSSLSILLSYSIPCGSYIYIMRDTTGIPSRGQRVSVAVAWVLIFVSTPLMIVSTANAVHNTFF